MWGQMSTCAGGWVALDARARGGEDIVWLNSRDKWDCRPSYRACGSQRVDLMTQGLAFSVAVCGTITDGARDVQAATRPTRATHP